MRYDHPSSSCDDGYGRDLSINRFMPNPCDRSTKISLSDLQYLHPCETGFIYLYQVHIRNLYFSYLYRNIRAVEKKCLDCGDIIRGRTDKKFCSDQCRNNYNNRLNRDSNNFVRNVHGLLRKNRRILADLYSEGKMKVHKDALFALGYNFSFFTHVIETSQGNTFHYCFEYGYREAGDDFMELSQNSQYLEYQ